MNRRASSWIIVTLIVAPFVLFLPETLGRSTWYVTDYQNYYYPYRKATVDLVRAGNLPLWNPYVNGGMPLLADAQTALFYPPTWLAFLMRPIHAVTLATILSYSIAGVGMFLYARALRFDRWISTIGAVGFMFCGYMTSQLVHPWMQATIAIVPWVFWGFERMLERPSAGRCVAAALIVALQLFAGHPQVPTYNAVAMGMYGLAIALPRLLRRDVRGALIPIVLLAIMYVAGALFAAIQLLPLVELASFSPRAAGSSFEMFISNSLAGTDWLLFLFPYAYGSVSTSFMQSLADVHYKITPISWERMAYVGLLPLVLAIVGTIDWLVHLKKRSYLEKWDVASLRNGDGQKNGDDGQKNGDGASFVERGDALENGDGATVSKLAPSPFFRGPPFSRGGAVVAVLVSMLALAAIGSLPPIAKLMYAIPVLGQYRANARTLGVIAFAINALAMFGAARIASRELDWLAVLVSAIVLITIGVVVALANSGNMHGYDDASRLLWESALKFPDRNATGPSAPKFPNRNAAVPLILAMFTLLVLLIPTRRASLKFSLFAALIASDLGAFARTYNASTPTADYDTGTPGAVAFLKSDPEPFRVAIFPGTDLYPPAQARPALVISWTLAYGIEDINSCNSLQPRRIVDWLVSTKHPDVLYAMLNSNRIQPPYDRALAPLDVKYAILQKGFPWFPPVTWMKVYEDEFCEIRRNPHPIARAFFAEFVKPLSDPREILRETRNAGFNPLGTALVEGSLSPDDVRPLWIGPKTAEMSRVANGANEQIWRTNTASPRLLVLSEMYFPGWRAMVRKANSTDAWQRVPIYQTNYLFRGIPVPAGDNEVRLVYRPMSVIIGAIITVCTAIGMAIAIVIGRGRRTRAAS